MMNKDEDTIAWRRVRQRFVNDYNLPIQVLDLDYFNYYLELYDKDYDTLKKWSYLVNLIKERFDNNPEKWVEYYSNVRNTIIETIEKSDEYKEFLSFDMNMYSIKNKNVDKSVGDINVYNDNFNNHILVSIDLKQANYQALKYHNPKLVMESETYEDFIGKFTDVDYIKDSKYTRQVIFGKLNPKRQITIEKWLINEILNSDNPIIAELKQYGNLVSIKSDELVFDITNSAPYMGCWGDFSGIHKIRVNGKLIYFKVENFKLVKMPFETNGGGSLNVWRKIDWYRNEKLKSAPIQYFPQIYKHWNNKEVEDKDLVFFHEQQLCKFMYPLTPLWY